LATGLDRSRFEPIVVLPETGELADGLDARGIEVLIRPLSILRRGLLHPRGLASLGAALARDAATLARIIRRRRAALVHSNTSVVFGGAAAAALTAVPHVWHVREIYSRFARAWPAYRRLLLTAQALPCVSRATAEQFGPTRRAVVVPDGLALAPQARPRLQARAALGLDPDLPVVAVVGRVSDWKGQDVLVKALSEPPLRARGTVGLIAGAPWPGAEDRLTRVLALADEVGVRERLRVVGFVADVATVYSAADVVAVPSTQPDPLPGAAIEAAAAGCAVVASAHGGLPEIISDGLTGRLVAPGDAAGLAWTCAELLDDEPQRRRLGSAAASDVRRRFAPDRLIGAVQSLYEAVRKPAVNR
jgi:glycosyltransferase involved in cell wall biosynthesis